MKKTIFSILMLALFTGIITLFLADPLGYDTVKSINEYGKYNRYVDSKLKTHFKGLLPAKEAVQEFGEEYIYYYGSGLMGNPSFSIYLSVQMDDEAFYKEEERVSLLAEQSLSADGL